MAPVPNSWACQNLGSVFHSLQIDYRSVADQLAEIGLTASFAGICPLVHTGPLTLLFGG